MIDPTLSSVCAQAHQLVPSTGVFDSDEILRRFPDLKSEKEFVFEIVSEEFFRRRELDPEFDPDSFFSRFANYDNDVREWLSVFRAFNSDGRMAHVEAALELTPGLILGDYLLLERLGRGAFGQVFLARQLSVSGRLVVVKFARVVEREVQALSRLSQCKHIVPVYTAMPVQDWDVHAICMPYLGRVTMHDVLESWFDLANLRGGDATAIPSMQKRQRPAQAESVRAFVHRRNRIAFTKNQESPNFSDAPDASDWQQELAQLWEADCAEAEDSPHWSGTYIRWVLERGVELLEALHEAHRRDILHCDVKPSNVLITDHGEARLFDFNLTKGCDSRMGGGTLPYMAPEQLRVTAKTPGDDRLTVQTDLFAWGTTMFQMLTGELPFGGFMNSHSGDQLADHQAIGLLTRQEAGRTDWRRVLAPLPSDIVSILASTLAYRPQDRPDSARALATALRLAIATHAAPGELTPQNALTRQQLRRSSGVFTSRRQMGAGFVLAAALLAPTLIAFLGISGEGSHLAISETAAMSEPERPVDENNLEDKPIRQLSEAREFDAFVTSFIQSVPIENTGFWNVSATAEGMPRAAQLVERSFYDAYNVRLSRDLVLGGSITALASKSDQYLREGKLTAEDHARVIVNEWDRWLCEGKYYEFETRFRYADIEALKETDLSSSYFHCLATKDLLEFIDLVADRPRKLQGAPGLSLPPAMRTPRECLESATEHLTRAFEAGISTPDIYLEKALLHLGEAYLDSAVVSDDSVQHRIAAAIETLDGADGILHDLDMRRLKEICFAFPTLSSDEEQKRAAMSLLVSFSDELLPMPRRFSNRRNASPRFRTVFGEQAHVLWHDRHSLPVTPQFATR